MPIENDNDFEKPITPERLEKIKWVLTHRQKDLTLVLANIHDPHNVSAIYRSCDAFGVSHVHLYYTHTEFPKLAKKTSASALKWVNTVRAKNKNDLLHPLKARGYQVIATSCSKVARPLAEWNFTRPTAVILGNEHSGVDSELLEGIDGELYIPMYGMIQSFNVSVAAAIILAEACRQRQLAGLYNKPSFTEDEYREMLRGWVDEK